MNSLRRGSAITLAMLVDLLVPAFATGSTPNDDDPRPPASSETTGEAPTSPDSDQVEGPELTIPRLPPPPIVAACEHLVSAENIRIALPTREMTLAEALRIAALNADRHIAGDWSALDAIGVRREDRIEAMGTPGSVPVVLDELLGLLADAWDRPRIEATADGLVVTSTSGAERLLGTVLHPTGDLFEVTPLPGGLPPVEIDPDPESLVDLVRDMIEPDAWAAFGGRLGRVQVVDRGLLVSAVPSIQIQVRRLLDQLRAGRPREVEVAMEIRAIDLRLARRLESSRGPGSLAAVRAVIAAADEPPLLVADLVTGVDGNPARASAATSTLQTTWEFRPQWHEAGQVLTCHLSLDLEGDAGGGIRRLEIEQAVPLPAGGLVIPIPAVDGQPELVALLTIRSR